MRLIPFFSLFPRIIKYIYLKIRVFFIPFNHPKFGPYYKEALNAILRSRTMRGVGRRSYVIGSILGALQAKNCGYTEITLIEFGVATGTGFSALMKIAEAIKIEMKMDVKVIGFDNKTGLPEPKGYRDHPEIWKASQFVSGPNFKIIEDEAKKKEHDLVIGDINNTLKHFKIEKKIIAFAAIDVDYFSSTLPITEYFKGLDSNSLLPATVLYFDDVLNVWTYSSFTGEELAIRLFNDTTQNRKIELKDRNLKLYALHDFKNVFRTGQKPPKFPLSIFVKKLNEFYV